jgi:hypothetical protein
MLFVNFSLEEIWKVHTTICVKVSFRAGGCILLRWSVAFPAPQCSSSNSSSSMGACLWPQGHIKCSLTSTLTLLLTGKGMCLVAFI